MTIDQHQNGDDSQVSSTEMVMETNTNLAPFRGMKEKYPNGLAEALSRRPDVTRTQLAEAADTSPQQINRLIHGEREMTALWAERLAPSLRVPPERLVFPDIDTVRAPLVSWATAARLAEGANLRKSDIRKYVHLSDLAAGDWVLLEAPDDSMDRIAPVRAQVCVNLADQALRNDKFYVFLRPDGTVFRRYREKPARLQPYSTNLDHETLAMTADTRVLGRVGRIITDLD